MDWSRSTWPWTFEDNISAGPVTATATWAGDDNHEGSTGAGSFTILKAPTTTTVSCPAGPFTYSGDVITPCSAETTGPGGLLVAHGVTYDNNIYAGLATASAEYGESPNYLGSSDSGTFVIGKAASVVTVVCQFNVTYTGSDQEECSAGVTGAGGLNKELTPTYANNIDVGTATATATYDGDDNHFGDESSASFEITEATSDTTVWCPAGPHVYTGEPITPECTANATGDGGLSTSVTPVTFTDNLNVGNASAWATYSGDVNHTGSTGSTWFAIEQAPSTVTILCTDPVTYTGADVEPCSATASGAGILIPIPLSISYTDNRNAGTATATAVWTGDDNHEGSEAEKTFTITKADSTTTITCPTAVTYTGDPQSPCTGAPPPAPAASMTRSRSTTPTTPTPARPARRATYAGDANHLDATAHSQADPACTIEGYTGTTTSAHGLSGSCSGVDDVDLTDRRRHPHRRRQPPVDWTFTGGTNYADQSDTATVTTSRPTCTATPALRRTAHGLSGSCSGVDDVDLTDGLDLGATHTDAGSYQVDWTFTGGTNYADQSDTATVTINQADATCTVEDYTGTTHSRARPTPLRRRDVDLTDGGGTHTDAGSYQVDWTFTGGTNYADQSDTATVTTKPPHCVSSTATPAPTTPPPTAPPAPATAWTAPCPADPATPHQRPRRHRQLEHRHQPQLPRRHGSVAIIINQADATCT